MKRLLLIDAYAMIYRAYYAFIRAPRINSKGENVSAVYGFVTTLQDLRKRLQPTHLAVAFDPQGGTFRHEAYAEYKAQREETPEDIRKAVPVIKTILEAMNIPVLEVPNYEADDVIGTVSVAAEKEGYMVFMATPDKDYGQLVTDAVHQFRPRHTGGFEDMGPKEVCNKYGLQSTSQVVDLLALMGDSSDNIPGCKGVGEKTAVQLLNQFGSVENLLSHTDQLKGALRTKVETQVEEIRFSKFLATICREIPGWHCTIADLAIRERDEQKVRQLFEALEFRSLLFGLRKPPVEAPQLPTPVKSKEATLDLFAQTERPAAASDAPTRTTVYPSVEEEQKGRLCAYLLNPETAFNPAREPDWDALKRDTALWNLYQEVELPLMDVLRTMEKNGVRFDVNLLKKAETELSAELATLEQDIYSLAGETFNINSPAQVGEILFAHLQLDDKAKRGKTGKFSTSEEVLQGLKDKHPIVAKIIEQRELKKLISTYIVTLPSFIDPATGKIHTTYNQTVTATGRLSSSNPNLQNLPIRTERGQLIRQAVIPDEGCMFMSADYSQIELRLMAHLSGDKHMIEAFCLGQDIHAATAAKIFHKPIEEVTKEERRRAKTANFGIIYGISSFGLAQQLDCSRAEAKALIDGYFEAFPQVVEYIERQKQFARENGFAVTMFGRRRYLPDITSQNSVVRQFAERNAVNAPIQGTAADIIKMAMVAIAQRLKDHQTTMIMQIHDELCFNVPVQEADWAKQMVVEEMQNVVHLRVPLIAECALGHNWLEAH
ncbi:MAG: DNA polymerase I [Paludibacteraceae bacterium]|nr:DNA polymerase I [Paludibacteraceae bacterium]